MILLPLVCFSHKRNLMRFQILVTDQAWVFSWHKSLDLPPLADWTWYQAFCSLLHSSEKEKISCSHHSLCSVWQSSKQRRLPLPAVLVSRIKAEGRKEGIGSCRGCQHVPFHYTYNAAHLPYLAISAATNPVWVLLSKRLQKSEIK